jgi:hypothetical protein
MKSVLTFVIVLVATSAFAQISTQYQSPIAAAEAACGPKNVKFEVKMGTTDPPQPEPGKALVFVIEDLGQCPDCNNGQGGFLTNVSNAVTKVGMDGAWVGANQGNSYFFFAATPGEHHLCINWQSRLQVRSRAFAMANFTAEEGKVYYFRERVFPGEHDYSFDLDPVNSDEGKYLVATSGFSVAHPKK